MHIKDAKTQAKITSTVLKFLDKISDYLVENIYKFFYFLNPENCYIIFSNIKMHLALRIIRPIKDLNVINIILDILEYIKVLGFFNKNRCLAILKKFRPKITISIIKFIIDNYFIEDQDTIKFIKTMPKDNQAKILILIIKKRRIAILSELRLKAKNCIIKNLINY